VIRSTRRILVDGELDDMVELLATLVEQPVERFRLRLGTGIAVEDRAALGLGESSRSPISAETIASETSSPASITALAWSPTGVPALTAARSMSPVESWTMPRSSTRRAA
jgi:hypothetical protein